MKWFKHFTNARDSKDLTKVRMKYGADGYAIYWYCLELIAADLGTSPTVTFELTHDAEVIGHNLKIDQLKVEEIMRYMVELGLFENSDNTITCLKLAKYLDKKTTRNSTIHAIIDAASKSDSAQSSPLPSETVPDSPPTVPLPSPLDTDTDTDKRQKHTSKAKARNVPYEAILDLYHEKLPLNPRIAKLSDSRKRQIRARWNDGIPDLDSWGRYFDMVSQSKFLTGRAAPSRDRNKPFVADIDFLIKEANVLKVVEGKYHE